jgi:hypothetical protein
MTHPRLVCRTLAAVLLTGFWMIGVALAQTTQATQATSAPTERTPITARVLEIRGDAKHAPIGSEDWQACAVDEEYPEQTVIETGVRSSIKLQIGNDDTYTAIVIESASRTVLSEAYRTADAKRVRIGVGYGRMRGGVAEGGLKSEFTVDSPVATLSKRGTWDFGLFFERGTDRFEIFLLDQGLVDAFSKVMGQHRTVLPRELVTQTMRRWLDQAQLVRNVPIVDFLGQADTSVAFNELDNSGLRVLNPEGGYTVLVDLSNTFSQDQFTTLVRHSLPTLGEVVSPVTGGRITRPEGFFGTGRGDELVPVTIAPNSQLAQKGFARPGTYTFRRAALEGWMRQQSRK